MLVENNIFFFFVIVNFKLSIYEKDINYYIENMEFWYELIYDDQLGIFKLKLGYKFSIFQNSSITWKNCHS